ncbi:MAG: GntR family transcriptional regulator [Burkholderiales bacterium]|nr:GntR family transcriptional regulator [Burkholderiales bacterium]
MGEILEPAEAAAPSQTVKAELRLRELVIGGELQPGQRIAELALVERIGVSRTPIRAALHRLAEEGLLDALPGGGFVVRQFSEADIHDAIELRGTLEGLAARLAAERGASPLLLSQARECVAAIDEVLAPATLDEAALADYAAQNARLHELLAAMAGSSLVQRQLERATALPFAGPNAFVLATAARSRESLLVAQAQHRAAVEAIAAREGARAEALMREHARIAQDNLREALKSPRTLPQIPGAGLIRRRGLR